MRSAQPHARATPVTASDRPVKCRLQMDTDGNGRLRVSLQTVDYAFVKNSTYTISCNVDEAVLPGCIRFTTPTNTFGIRMEMPYEHCTEAVTAAMSECHISRVQQP